jgi:carboxypeptidase T
VVDFLQRGFHMKKTVIALNLLLIAILLCPTFPATVAETSQKDALVLKSVREQRLRDIQFPVHIPQTTGLYRTYAQMTSLLQNLTATYPNIMSLSSIGKTYEGRELWMVKISDNVSQQETEPEVLFMGTHHGNEKPGYEVCLYFIQYLVEHYQNTSTPEVRDIINTTQIYVLPMVNPDGVEADTRKNAEPNHGFFGFNPLVTSQGVDLNRNYGYRWYFLFLFPKLLGGSTSYFDSSEVYHGPRPFSENETQAIRQFIDTHNIMISISYHTYGQLVLYPWGYTILPPKDKSLFVSIGENITAIDNYTLEQSISLYPTVGDACDWMYGTHGVLAYTIELGTSYAPTNPATLQKICATHNLVNLYICQRAHTLQ